MEKERGLGSICLSKARAINGQPKGGCLNSRSLNKFKQSWPNLDSKRTGGKDERFPAPSGSVLTRALTDSAYLYGRLEDSGRTSSLCLVINPVFQVWEILHNLVLRIAERKASMRVPDY